MLIFGLDTCCMPATAAICDGEKLVGEFVINCGKTHSQKIMPQIENMFKSLEISCSDIDCFAAACGPGSFTGVRIGAATLKSMAHAARKPCVSISTLMALAQNAAYFDGIICPILDARRGQVYTAMFEGGDEEVRRITEDSALKLSELIEILSGKNKRILFLGDGIFVHRKEIREKLGNNALFASPNINMNMAGAVAFLGAQAYIRGETAGYESIVPNYIRVSQAERERSEKLKGEK